MGVTSKAKRVLLMVCAVALLGAASGCGDQAAGTYTGPLYSDGEHGAAGDAIQCSTPVRGGIAGHSPYAEGATAQTLDGAWETARSEAAFDGATSTSGYEIAAEDEDRVLYAFEVGGEPKQAVIIRNGPATDGAGGPGWYVESWARCDLSEFPDAVAEANFGLQIWTDDTGERVSTGQIESYPGPEHCDWQNMTFLYLNEDGPDQAFYVRRPDSEPYLREHFAEPFDSTLPLPADAVDTGYECAGEHLWLSPDEQRAYVGTSEQVELWPRTIKPLRCL